MNPPVNISYDGIFNLLYPLISHSLSLQLSFQATFHDIKVPKMESSASSQTRDRPQERRARTKTTTTTTSTPTQSSSPAPTRTKVAQRKSTKSIPRKKTEAPVYATKYQAVLAEKVVNGRVKYLVNWANDPKTGDPYEPTWVCIPGDKEASWATANAPCAFRNRKIS